MKDNKKCTIEICEKCCKCEKCGECCSNGKKNKKFSGSNHAGGCGGFYFLGFIGSAVFFVGNATSFWDGVLGLLQAMVWPAFLVYEALSVLIK